MGLASQSSKDGENVKRVVMMIAALVFALSFTSGLSLTLGRISAYTPHESPGRMACGPARADAVALSRDLFYKGGKKRCGDLVRITYRDAQGRTRHTTRVVWDTTSARYSRTADLYLMSHSSAMRFGIRRGTLRFLN